MIRGERQHRQKPFEREQIISLWDDLSSDRITSERLQ